MTMLTRTLRPALTLMLAMTLLLGFAYPLLLTGVAQLAFRNQANGSLIERDGKLIGSRLIGQSFTEPQYFWGRPSATAPQPYNALASGGSNLGPLNPALIDAVKSRLQALRAADPDNAAAVPVELVEASASGLDPDVSPAAAAWQAGRVARARGLALAEVQSLLAAHTVDAPLGFIGEARVNVLELNLALDEYDSRSQRR
jgi:K+-transporting ATPase ATPase C chain